MKHDYFRMFQQFITLYEHKNLSDTHIAVICQTEHNNFNGK